ncbi:hypothetical protein F2Q69_00053477 [Brassica cretica]|uniref:Uncharacterized protein n=1 Tax=Brassica cretica TaxID=69181 RepID=A0A8S9N6C1_BRACR|nr:hypothetical protein F2Q69_00053477 [Brassica cretica]
MTHEDFAAKHPHPPSPVYVKIDRHSDPSSIDIRSPSLIDIRRPPKPKASENPPEAVRRLSDDGIDSMEVDRVPTVRILRKRKEKVAKHLKRGANEKEKESFRKRVSRIPLEKPFDEAYYTHRL